MWPEFILDVAIVVSLVFISISLLVCVYRVIVGPTLPDRVLALDMLALVAIGFIAVNGIRTGFTLYVDIAIALGLVGFLATVAFSRFILLSASKDRGKGAEHKKITPNAGEPGDDIGRIAAREESV